MWSDLAIGLACFIAGVGVTCLFVFINTVADDIRRGTKDAQATINLVHSAQNAHIAETKQRHEMVLHEISKVQKAVKELHVEKTTPPVEANLDNRSI